MKYKMQLLLNLIPNIPYRTGSDANI